MKKVVLVLDGVVAKTFLDSVLEKYFSNNLYVVIVKDPSMIPEKIPSAFHFYHFDFTSAFHLNQTFEEHRGNELSDVFLIIEDPAQKRAVFDICRKICKEARFVTFASGFDEEYLTHKNERTIFIDDSDVVAGQFISRLPNVPIIPRGFGLGKGEIMEVGVPFGSAFAYRHIGSIQQKNYKIIGLYRQNKLLLSTFSLVIQPQDIVLVAGDPKTLTNIYKQIKSDIGQFPSPFGRDIHVYVDMLLQKPNVLFADIEQAIFFHNLIRSTKLFVNVLSPSNFDMIYAIKEICAHDPSIVLNFDYQNLSFAQKLQNDSAKKIGLIVVGKEIFSSRTNRKVLFKTASPVLKTGSLSLKEAKTSVVVVNEEMNEGENISSVIFDVAIQTKMDIQVYDFEPDAHHQDAILKNYEALGRGFGKKVQIIKSTIKNPIFHLNDFNEAVLHFLPFEERMVHSKAFALFSTKTERVALLLNKHPQMLVPIG